MAAGDGLISMTPTSIAHSGTSATINSDGGVDFSAVTSLSLNGVFTGDYDNYLMVMGGTLASANAFVTARLRASGSDASGTNYTRQRIYATGSTAAGSRETSQDSIFVSIWHSNLPNGFHLHLYGPALAQPTAMRSVGVQSDSSAYLIDTANTHSLSTSYDGITMICATAITGTIHVFGYEE